MDYFEQLEKEQQAHNEKKDIDFGRMQTDWQALFFGTEQGMRVLADFLELSEYFGTNFTGNSRQFFLEGMRYFVSHIIRFAGLDSVEGLHRLSQIRVAAEQRRKNNERG